MKKNYSEALNHVLKYEGGYVNHSKDPGGPTNMGITQRTYDGWRRSLNRALRSVELITFNEAASIYKRDYADKVRFNQLPSGLDFAMFDFAVNSGVARAVKFLQAIVGTTQDGVLGSITLGAVAKREPKILIKRLCEHRHAFLIGLRAYQYFGRGWSKRVESVKHYAFKMASNSDESPTLSTVAPSGSVANTNGKAYQSGRGDGARRSPENVVGLSGALTSVGLFSWATIETLPPWAPYVGLCLAGFVLGFFLFRAKD